MKTLMVLLTVTFTNIALAEPGEIRCQAEYRVITQDGIVEPQVKKMVKTHQDSRSIRFEAELNGRSFSLSGDTLTGDFMLSQTWGAGFTEGVLTTTSFNSDGRLQVSTVTTIVWFDPKDKELPREEQKYPNGITGSQIYKLVCNKTLASQFPKQ